MVAAVAVAVAVAVGWVVLKYSECSRVDEWSESITPPPSPPAGRPSERDETRVAVTHCTAAPSLLLSSDSERTNANGRGVA